MLQHNITCQIVSLNKMKYSELFHILIKISIFKGCGYICKAQYVWLKGIQSHLIIWLKSQTLISHPSTAHTKTLQAITTKTLGTLIHSSQLYRIYRLLWMQGRRKTMINWHACVHKYLTEHQAIPDHWLKSIFLQLHQRKAIKAERERKNCVSLASFSLLARPNNRKWMCLLTDNKSYHYSRGPNCICHWVCDQHISAMMLFSFLQVSRIEFKPS